ncbi:MAG TPA: ferrochelatase [Bryobacteraceae bacterium]|jgi:ferrochelatase
MLYDALIVVSFGGPEKTEDVIPFLENVLRGRNVPRERMLEVAEHYYHFGGKSPINDQNRALVAALRTRLDLPVYWGNRNWHPFLADTFRQMKKDRVRRALAFVTSAFGSYSGCRQYRENIASALEEVNREGQGEPLMVHKLRTFSNHPLFIETMAERTAAALEEIPVDRRQNCRLVFTAHSVPVVMAQSSGYEQQLRETSGLVAARVGGAHWDLVFQSRSGPPTQAWLEPDIGDWLRREHPSDVVVVPIGFISDHMEVLYDLDTEVAQLARDLGIHLVRAQTAGTHPKFIEMADELIRERTHAGTPRRSEGTLGPAPDECAQTCCAWARRP